MNAPEYKKLRVGLGTQAKVAEMLDVTREAIARRETGATRITREAALALKAIVANETSAKKTQNRKRK